MNVLAIIDKYIPLEGSGMKFLRAVSQADLSVKTDSTDSTDKNETVLSVTVIGTPNRQKKLSASLAKTF